MGKGNGRVRGTTTARFITEDRPPRIGIWCAVSSKAQASEDKVSLEDQERAGRQFAEQYGGVVVSIYRVPGHTRDLIFWSDAEAAMPAYRELRRDVETGAIDVLWNRDLDRLGRDAALVNQVISLVEKSGAEVYTAATPHQLGNKGVGFRYVAAIQAVRAGEDQEIRIAKYRSGMKGRIMKRGMLPSRTPMGYNVVRDPQTGESVSYEFNDYKGAVDLIVKLYLAGEPIDQIAREMDQSPWRPPRTGERWWPGTIKYVVNNDAYAGFPTWGAYTPEERSDAYPAMWDEDTHAAIVRERQRRGGTTFTRRGSGPYTNIAYCQRCGTRMHRYTQKHKTVEGEIREYPYMMCGQRRRTIGDDPCHRNHTAEHKITDAIAEFLNWLSTAENLASALAAWEEKPGQSSLHDELENNQTQVENLGRQRERLGYALSEGKMDFDLYRKLDDDLLARYETAVARVASLETEIGMLLDYDARKLILERLAGEFSTLVERGQPAALSALLQHAGLIVWCEDGEIVEIELN